MIYCYVDVTEKDAYSWFTEFITDNEDRIERVYTSKMVVISKGGGEHWFMGRKRYRTWCLGRTYMRGKHLYHSGELIGGKE